jgi:fatty-acyl-CoA synthase
MPTVYRQELSPNHFIERAGDVFRNRCAVQDGATEYTWHAFRARVRRFASALREAGLGKGDRIALLAFNSEPMLLAHFAVPLAGGVLVAINTRLSPDEIAYVIEHSGARTVFFSPELEPGLAKVPAEIRRVDVQHGLAAFMASGSDAALASWLDDEYESLAINYTSGTTGRPKGVVYHHRGAYLNAVAMALEHRLEPDSTFLWTLPMFHCNGWTFPWALAAVGAKSLCIPKIDVPEIWKLLTQGVTHLCAAPTVLLMLANDPAARRLTRPVRVFTAGAPPSPTLLAQLAQLGFHVDHVYGLTETYGPFTINVVQPERAADPEDVRARDLARQGVPHTLAGELRVVDAELRDVPADAQTMGEVVMRGNIVMKGYFNDEPATERAFQGGWFHSGDIAVVHPDGYIELKDRSKDVMISGAENISTIEVEQAIASHPAVLECAVVGIPHERWGEVPKAFVTLKAGRSASAEEIIAHCRSRIAHFKAPKQVEFCELPKTSTGKIQKFQLREREWRGHAKRIQ